MTSLIGLIDGINRRVGLVVMWLTAVMALMQFTVVILRYVFAIGFIPMQESIWYMNGIIFMMGAGFTLLQDAHVRVDVVYREASARFKATVDLVGAFIFLLPLCIATFVLSQSYVLNAWRVLEGSTEASGLPFIYLLKTVIWVFALLLGLQGLALALRAAKALFEQDEAYTPAAEKGNAGH